MSLQVLKSRHSHPRDIQIKFYNRGHKYEIASDKQTQYTSVTTWVKSHFPKFDADAIIQNMFASKSWGPEHKYWGMTAEEIKKLWNANSTSVSCAGTDLHTRIEHFMNDKRFQFEYTQKELCEIYMSDHGQKLSEEPLEWQYFIEFVRDHPELKPYRTEWMVYDEDLKFAGSIDMVYENPDGTLSIYDWKRSKDIQKNSSWNKFASNPTIGHLHDTNFWHYALQLNTYKTILERKYNKNVTKLCLVRLHPDTYEKTYELLDVPILDKEMSDLIAERVGQI